MLAWRATTPKGSSFQMAGEGFEPVFSGLSTQCSTIELSCRWRRNLPAVIRQGKTARLLPGPKERAGCPALSFGFRALERSSADNFGRSPEEAYFLKFLHTRATSPRSNPWRRNRFRYAKIHTASAAYRKTLEGADASFFTTSGEWFRLSRSEGIHPSRAKTVHPK